MSKQYTKQIVLHSGLILLCIGQQIAAGNPTTANSVSVSAELSVGDLMDKITILEIKVERIDNYSKKLNIVRELESLYKTVTSHLTESTEFCELTKKLRYINTMLWDIEDNIRRKIQQKEYDEEFIEIAKSVSFNNNIRFLIKRQINELVGSRLIEEKSSGWILK